MAGSPSDSESEAKSEAEAGARHWTSGSLTNTIVKMSSNDKAISRGSEDPNDHSKEMCSVRIAGVVWLRQSARHSRTITAEPGPFFSSRVMRPKECQHCQSRCMTRKQYVRTSMMKPARHTHIRFHPHNTHRGRRHTHRVWRLSCMWTRVCSLWLVSSKEMCCWLM